MAKEIQRLDRRSFIKSLGLVAGALALPHGTTLAQPALEDRKNCPLEIEVGEPLIKLRRPEQKFTVYFDLLVEMPQGKLIEVKRTVRIIRAITRKFRTEEVIFVPVSTKKRDISKEIRENRIAARGEGNVLVDFGYICNTLSHLNGTAFAVEILVEARGITADKGQICSANKLVVQNFDVPKVCE